MSTVLKGGTPAELARRAAELLRLRGRYRGTTVERSGVTLVLRPRTWPTDERPELPRDQIEKVITRLKRSPGTRRCVITPWWSNPDDRLVALSLQPSRDGELDCHAFYRDMLVEEVAKEMRRLAGLTREVASETGTRPGLVIAYVTRLRHEL